METNGVVDAGHGPRQDNRQFGIVLQFPDFWEHNGANGFAIQAGMSNNVLSQPWLCVLPAHASIFLFQWVDGESELFANTYRDGVLIQNADVGQEQYLVFVLWSLKWCHNVGRCNSKLRHL
jgi:hypothetical protein